MSASAEVLVWAADDPADPALERLLNGPEPFVAVHQPDIEPSAEVLDALVRAMAAPMAATASPVPASGGSGAWSVILDASSPAPPTVSAPCPRLVLIARTAVASLPRPPAGSVWAEAWSELAQRLVVAGWRHVVAPGSAAVWSLPDDPVNGPANEGLHTHRLWVETRRRGVRLVVDGACLSDDPHNGSQEVVWNVTRALHQTRPEAAVSLAVPAQHVDHLAKLAAGSGVSVVARTSAVSGFDVAYRPYQPIDPSEIGWLVAAGERLLTSQLDMIAFSNPAYHPSPALFHAVRNLQRRTMRLADGVTFISEFGRQGALAECPDLDLHRTFVVACGADPTPVEPARPSAEVERKIVGRFIACTSATFWHKNRQHAIRVFAEMCRAHGYDGSLVIAGPEPHYGGSSDTDHQLIASLPSDVRRRVILVGRVDAATKWWLLEHADLVLYPSTVEGFGLVPFEAAAVGTACLASGASALGEILGATGAALESWDARAWAETAAGLIESVERRDALTRDVNAVAEQLTWAAAAEHTWQAVDAVLARPRRHRHAEEGGLTSRIAGDQGPLAAGARLTHFANRLRSYAERRLGR